MLKMTDLRSTIHNEYGRLESVLLCNTQTAFRSSENIRNQWKSLNFLEMPDFKKAQEEYTGFTDLLAKQHAQLHWLGANDPLSLDALYCRDASIATDYGLILCNMGKDNRKPEPMVQAEFFKGQQLNILGVIEAPGTLEGGDVAWIDQDTLAVGMGYRTNESGIAQLRKLLSPNGIRVIEVDLPHYRGPEDVFHLMSVFSPVDKDLAVVYSPLMPVRFRNELLERGYELVEVPDEEFESLGCNVLAIAPRTCIMAAGNPKTKSLLEDSGCVVHTYEGVEISLKGGGGPTCLTRPLVRSLQI